MVLRCKISNTRTSGKRTITQPYTQISKFLSYVLRHKPDAIGLELDAEGWAYIPELSRLVLAGQRLAGMIPLFPLIWRTGYGGQITIAGNGFGKIGS